MSSGTILIYDKSGVDLQCLLATYKQIKEQADDRSLKVEYFSQHPNCDSVRLFVIPGGNYTRMADELKPLAPRIRKLVLEDGASYLGICAGAIAAARDPLLIYMKKLAPYQLNPSQDMVEMPAQVHLQLYSGDCCYFDVPGGEKHGTQEIQNLSSKQKVYHLYFNKGVFFPSATHEPYARPLLTFPSYKFSGWYKNATYENIVPVAAVTQQVGKGRLLLSGVHPEIGPDTVEGLQKTNEDDRNATMRGFLSSLAILTKKV